MKLTAALLYTCLNRRRAVLLFALLVPAASSGQSVDVTITGIVTDPSGAVLRGVTVTATNRQTSLVRSTTSDGLGRYSLPPVPPGEYQVKAELSGFRPHVRDNQMLHVGSTISLDLTLHVLTAAEAVDVVASAPVLETTKLNPGQLHPRAVKLYNALHSFAAPTALAVASFWLAPAWFGAAFAWMAHVCFDRAVGFGLRDNAGYIARP
jgi:hypothetical protein